MQVEHPDQGDADAGSRWVGQPCVGLPPGAPASPEPRLSLLQVSESGPSGVTVVHSAFKWSPWAQRQETRVDAALRDAGRKAWTHFLG